VCYTVPQYIPQTTEYESTTLPIVDAIVCCAHHAICFEFRHEFADVDTSAIHLTHHQQTSVGVSYRSFVA